MVMGALRKEVLLSSHQTSTKEIVIMSDHAIAGFPPLKPKRF
jgi:hypothetical protein